MHRVAHQGRPPVRKPWGPDERHSPYHIFPAELFKKINPLGPTGAHWVDYWVGGAPPGALIGGKRLCPRASPGHGGRREGKARPNGHQASSTAAAPGEGAKGHRHTPEGRGGDNGSAKAAERRAPTRGTTRAAASSSHPAEHRSSSKHGRVRGVCTEGGRAPQKTQPPQRRRPPISAPRPIFGRFRPPSYSSALSALSALSARGRLLGLWCAAAAVAGAILVVWW